jgi:hypothetical protein
VLYETLLHQSSDSGTFLYKEMPDLNPVNKKYMIRRDCLMRLRIIFLIWRMGHEDDVVMIYLSS